MTRKDVILIGALANAGLLIILCATALSPQSHAEKLVSAPLATPPIATEFTLPPPAPALVVDEVDRMLFPSSTLQIITPDEVMPAATPSPKETPSSSQPFVDVIVKKGDSLDKIAKMHKTTVEKIMNDNHLASSRLSIGQVLKVSPAQSITPPPEPTHPEEKYYTVKPGDTPWAIAAKNRIKLEELLELNHLDETKAKRLRPGDRLRIR